MARCCGSEPIQGPPGPPGEPGAPGSANDPEIASTLLAEGSESGEAVRALAGPVRNMDTGEFMTGYRYVVLVDPANPLEIEDIIVEAI